LTGLILGRGIDFVRRQHRALKVNIAKNLVANFSMGLTQQYQSIYVRDLGAGPMELGYINSVGGFSSTLITLPAGWLADRFGVRRMLLAGLALMAAGYAVFGAAPGWQLTAIGLVLTTVSTSVTWVVCPMVCGNVLRSEERVTGMQLCDTVSAFPRLAAPLIAAYVISALGGMTAKGIRPLFWAQVACMLVAIAIIYFLFEDLARPGSNRASFVSGFRRVFSEGVMVRRWLAFSMLTALPMYLAFYAPLYAKEVKGAGSYVVGLMDSAHWLVVVLLAIPVGLGSDRFGRRRVINLLTPLYCASMLLLVHAPNDVALVASGLLSGFFMLSAVVQAAISIELVPRELLGSWSGVISLFRGIVNIASPIIGGFLWESLGPEAVFYFIAATQVVKLLILASIPSKVTRG